MGAKREGRNLHRIMLLAMGVGLLAGVLLHALGHAEPGAGPDEVAAAEARLADIVWWLDLFGRDLFIGALKLIIAPLILFSIVAGITSLPHARHLGSIGWKTLLFYVTTTSIAVAIGLAVVLMVRPGERGASTALRAARAAELKDARTQWSAAHDGADPLDAQHRREYALWLAQQEGEHLDTGASSAQWQRVASVASLRPREIVRRDIIRPLLMNPFESLASLNSLGIILFSILLGLAVLAIGEAGAPVARFFAGASAAMMRVTHWVMWIAPVGVACLLARLVGTLGMDAVHSLAWYGGTVILGILVHVGVLCALAAGLGRVGPLTFLRGVRETLVVAFTTTSSAAALPVSLECVTENLKVSPRVANFGIPLGCTINMDGTALYEGVAVIFLLQAFGGLDDVHVVLGGATTLVIFVTAVLASVGAAAVPSAGLVTMALVANAVGLPLYYLPIIFAVDHVLDMFRTATNVLGDCAGAVVVQRYTANDG